MYTYIIRCNDNTLYCGYTTDIKRRLNEHKNSVGSKYVRSRGFRKLEFLLELNSKSDAMRAEIWIKKLNKIKKESLISGDLIPLEKLDISYKVIDNINLLNY